MRTNVRDADSSSSQLNLNHRCEWCEQAAPAPHAATRLAEPIEGISRLVGR